MTKQHVRFNYFVPELNYENGNNFRWNMKDFLEFLLNHKGKIESSVILGDEVADFEWEDQQLVELIIVRGMPIVKKFFQNSED